jgi:hypothetical protein
MAAESSAMRKWMGMATDYDAPRKTEDDSESIEALKERVPDKMSGVVDVDDADNPGGFDLAGADPRTSNSTSWCFRPRPTSSPA